MHVYIQLSIHICVSRVGVSMDRCVHTLFVSQRLSICKGSGSSQSLELRASHATPCHGMGAGPAGSMQLLAAALTWRLNERETVCV